MPDLAGRLTEGGKEGWDARGPRRLWLGFWRVGGTAMGEQVWGWESFWAGCVCRACGMSSG